MLCFLSVVFSVGKNRHQRAQVCRNSTAIRVVQFSWPKFVFVWEFRVLISPKKSNLNLTIFGPSLGTFALNRGAKFKVNLHWLVVPDTLVPNRQTSAKARLQYQSFIFYVATLGQDCQKALELGCTASCSVDVWHFYLKYGTLEFLWQAKGKPLKSKRTEFSN